MNAFRPLSLSASTSLPARTAAAVAALDMPAALARRERRERDFGVGYGNSSGYASTRRYTQDWATPRFRFG